MEEEEPSQDDSRSLFNNAALRGYTPICLGSLFALYMLQTIEPANLLPEFTVFVNRVIAGEQKEREGERGLLIGKTLNTGGVSSLVSPLD